MIVKSLFLLNTPLDNSYRDVIDFNFHKEFSDFTNFDVKYVLTNYLVSHFLIQIPDIAIINKSIKIDNNSSSVVIPRRREDVIDANYLVAKDGTKSYYFFVTNITSENDSETNPSCKLNIVWDSWNNNIDKIALNGNCKNEIATSHFNRFSLNSGELNPIFPYTPPIVVPNILKNTLIGDGYLPIFMVYQFNDNISDIRLTTQLVDELTVELELDNEDKVQFRFGDSVNGQYNRNVLYTLIGIYDVSNDTYIYENIRVYNNALVYYLDNDYNEMYSYYETTKILDLPQFPTINASNELLNYVNKIYVTMNDPFGLELVKTDYGFSINFYERLIAYLPSVGAYCIAGNYDTVHQPLYQPKMFSYDLNLNDTKSTIEVDLNSETGYSSVINNKSNFIYSSKTNDLIEPSQYCKPFKYVTLDYGNNEISLDQVNPLNRKFTIHKSLVTPQVHLYVTDENGNRIYSQNDLTVDAPQPYSMGTSAVSTYEINNGSEYKTSKSFISYLHDSKLTSAITNVASSTISGALAGAKGGWVGALVAGGVSAVASTISNIGSYNADSRTEVYENAMVDAKMNDLLNRSATFFPSMGECDIKYHDRIRFTLHYTPSNNVDLINHLNECYYYGYERYKFENVFENTRAIFDFCRTTICKFNHLRFNSTDRYIIESAFNRGLTKWHINIDRYGDIIYENYNFNKDKSRNNIEKQFILDPDYIQWLNS